MARSSRIYLVYNDSHETELMPIAAFTVKAEAVYFINTHVPAKLRLVGGPDGRIGVWDNYNLDGTMKRGKGR